MGSVDLDGFRDRFGIFQDPVVKWLPILVAFSRICENCWSILCSHLKLFELLGGFKDRFGILRDQTAKQFWDLLKFVTIFDDF